MRYMRYILLFCGYSFFFTYAGFDEFTINYLHFLAVVVSVICFICMQTCDIQLGYIYDQEIKDMGNYKLFNKVITEFQLLYASYIFNLIVSIAYLFLGKGYHRLMELVYGFTIVTVASHIFYTCKYYQILSGTNDSIKDVFTRFYHSVVH